MAGLGDLDRCNGRRGVTPEFPDGTYYYVLTATLPYIPRCFAGTPDSSFRHSGGAGAGGSGHAPGQAGTPPPLGGQQAGGPPQGGPAPGGGGRHPDLNQAAATLGIDVETLRRALGPPPPDLARAAAELGISEQQLRQALPRPRQ